MNSIDRVVRQLDKELASAFPLPPGLEIGKVDRVFFLHYYIGCCRECMCACELLYWICNILCIICSTTRVIIIDVIMMWCFKYTFDISTLYDCLYNETAWMLIGTSVHSAGSLLAFLHPDYEASQVEILAPLSSLSFHTPVCVLEHQCMFNIYTSIWQKMHKMSLVVWKKNLLARPVS